LEKPQDDEVSKHSTEILGNLFSGNAHGIQDSNTIESEFKPDLGPEHQGNQEVDSRDDQEKESHRNHEAVQKQDQEQWKEVVVAMQELGGIDLMLLIVSDRISTNEPDSKIQREGQKTTDVRNAGDSQS